MLIALHKPYGVLCQFSDRSGSAGATLADFVPIPEVYPAGRLDKHSEGLLLLTDDGALQHQISDPTAKTSKEYWVQLEKRPDAAFASRLRTGTQLADGRAAADQARLLNRTADQVRIAKLGEHPGNLAAHRAFNSTWYSLTLTSGRNRIVRRLCAALGHPVLRLVRVRIGRIELADLAPGQFRPETWP